MRQRVQSVKL